MNKETIQGDWKQVKGRLKSRWGKLTDDNLRQAEGDYDVLCGRIQKAYGVSLDQVRKDLNDLN